MLEKVDISKVLFLDIETTSSKNKFEELESDHRELFLKSFKNKGGAEAVTIEQQQELYDRLAPLYVSEWGQIIVISVLKLEKVDEKTYKQKMISFADKDEKKLLTRFVTKLESYFKSGSGISICSHNGEVFDWPQIQKKLILNGIMPPDIFNDNDKKPWEKNQKIDTKKEWACGIYSDSNVSLENLARIFNVPSPKSDINGADVKRVYYTKENGLERIRKYCEQDVVCLSEVVMGMRCLGESLIK